MGTKGTKITVFTITLVLISVSFSVRYVENTSAVLFSSNVLVDDSPAGTYEPSIALDISGKLHAVWRDTRNGFYLIRYSNSTDGGATWSSSKRVDNNPFLGLTTYEPSIVVDTSGGAYDGNLYVVWRDTRNGDYDIFLSNSTDGGITWSADVRVDSAPVDISSYNPSIAVDDGGTVYVAWHDSRSGEGQIYISRSNDGGSSWIPDVGVSPSSNWQSQPSIATYGTGTVYIAWDDEGSTTSIMSARSVDSGDTWSAVTVVTGSDYRGNVDIAVDLNEKIYLTWMENDYSGVTPLFYSGSSDQGSSWTPKIRVDDCTSNLDVRSPKIGVNSLSIYVVWADNRYGDYDIFFSESKDGGITWGDGISNDNDIRINDNLIGDGTVQNQPDIAVTDWGIYAIWSDARSGTSDIYFSSYVVFFLWITEFQDSPDGSELIEIINYGGKNIDLTGYYLLIDGAMVDLTPLGMLPRGQYRSIGDPASADLQIPITMGDEGGIVSIYNDTGVPLDEVRYGQLGTAPDPLSGESTARYWNGVVYLNDWTRDSTPTFGGQNDVPAIDLAPKVVLNEVMFYPQLPSYGFVELMYIGTTSIDTGNYKIVCDTEYTVPATTLDTIDPYFLLFYPDDSTFFDQMTYNGDNIYLYDDNGLLLDMVGWDSEHTQNLTVSRVPNGNGTYQGYDDVTSKAAGWVFNRSQSIPFILIGPDQIKQGDPGDVVTYGLTIKNKQDVADRIDITNASSPGGWPVEIFDESGSIKISNVTLGPRGSPTESVNIRVDVTIPLTYPAGNTEYTTVNITSSNNPLFWDSAILETQVYLYVEPFKTVVPDAIYVRGTGFDEEATLTLRITGKGVPFKRPSPQDVVFVIDSSGSMVNNDPNDERKEAAKGYVDKLSGEDRAAVVDFDDNAWLVPFGWPIGYHLSTDYARIKANIDTIDSLDGTDIYQALLVANNEFLGDGINPGHGDITHVWVEILLTDGNGGNYGMIINEANRAADNGIIIYTIGLNTSGDADWQLLQQIADITGGRYYEAPDPSYLDDIYDDIGDRVSRIAGRDFEPTDTNPMVRDTLPSYIDYVPGSFIDPTTGNPRNPDSIGGGGKVLEWNVSAIVLNETWSVSFRITSSQLGFVPTNVFEESRINYTNYANNSVEKLFPEAWINVTAPLLPPKLYVKASGDDIILNWTQPRVLGISHYLLYRSASQTGFNFSEVWVNTSENKEPGEPNPISLRTMWNDTGAASDNASQEYYYAIRAVLESGEISYTSRTVGKYTRIFPAGVSPFSLPLEPLQTMWTDDFTADMGANYIKHMDTATHTWVQNNVILEVGKGYEINLYASTKFTFTGMPAAMILYDDVSFGFDAALDDSAAIPAATVDDNGNVTLSWLPAAGVDSGYDYHVFRSSTRDGFWGVKDTDYEQIANLPFDALTYQDIGIADEGTGHYYMVVPVNLSTNERGSSSYSIGVWTAGYLGEYDTFAIPLKPSSYQTADWYCENIPDTVGINYYINGEQRWGWHSTRMSPGAYDPMIEMGVGYQVSTLAATKFSFVGW